ncbi:sulfatase family protein [Novipirellula artificiosorum]|uniref:Arylsulfatase n=1 Tax=Novipirellula artificiosorum TaxID=2528016 RepID=A0A5C6DBN0_9BACT|nr:arylsulfatase [Novipirellula artificiosorum]TWU32329.1 Arylsulfatase [Novipirellula artificiosorum]
MNSHFSKYCVSLCLTFVSGGWAMTAQAQAEQPNIVYILADDMGYGDVSACNPDSKIQTPNIDRLAREGMQFIDAHTNSSVCTPTRYGILTGRYCWRTEKKSGVLHGHSDHLIDPGRETVASFLKDQGYATACIGKWHLGMDWTSGDGLKVNESSGKNVDFDQPIANGPLDRGFEYYFGISASLNHAPHAYVENRKALGELSWLEGNTARKERNINGKDGWVADNYHQAEVLSTFTEKTIDWLQQHHSDASQQPFFVYMPLSAPHAPIVPNENFQGKNPIGAYGDYCMEVDWVVGEVLNALEDLELTDNTLVIFTSDNGPSPQAKLDRLQAHGHYASANFRGLKGSLWEAGHRVPFLARWPAVVKPGTVSDQVICTTDLLATVGEMHNAKLPDHVGEDSVSFLPALQGKPIPGNTDRGVVHHSDSGVFAIRRGKWKVVFDPAGGTRRNNPKDPPIKNPADIQLYDMEHDSGESTNLQAQHPEQVDALGRLLGEFVARGRSTPGADRKHPEVKRWTQLDAIRRYLKDSANTGEPHKGRS